MIHVLRTRSPVYSPLRAFSLDLHVLGTPPAFVLSQDQTLQLSIGVSIQKQQSPSRLTAAATGASLSRPVAKRNTIGALKALRVPQSFFVDLLSSFQRPTWHALLDSALPTTSPPRRVQHPGEGRASYRCQLLRVKDLASGPARTPRLQGPRCVADPPMAVNFPCRPAPNPAYRLQIPPPLDGFAGALSFFKPCPTR